MSVIAQKYAFKNFPLCCGWQKKNFRQDQSGVAEWLERALSISNTERPKFESSSGAASIKTNIA